MSAATAGALLRLLHRLLGAARVLLGLVLISMVAINVVNAAGRYLFGFVLIGADELLVLSMIWLVMLGAVVATAERSHLSLAVLATILGPRGQSLLLILQEALLALAAGYAAWQSWSFVARIARLGQTSMALGIPASIQHAALLVGFAGIAAVALMLALREVARLLSAPTGGAEEGR